VNSESQQPVPEKPPPRRVTGERIAITVLSGLIVVLFAVIIAVAVHQKTRVEIINRTVTIDQQAKQADLGFCFETGPNDGGYATAYAPSYSGSVVSCPNGQFISVVPGG